jgi:hypothetical protein
MPNVSETLGTPAGEGTARDEKGMQNLSIRKRQPLLGWVVI